MKKISTGITGLDVILEGGYPLGKTTLLKGGPGTGKTIFCQLFINSCLLKNYHVSFIMSEESPENMMSSMDEYGFNTTEAIKNNKLSLLNFCPNFNDQIAGEFELDIVLLRTQQSLAPSNNILIIDSLQNLFVGLRTENHVRSLLSLFDWCREHDVTLLCTVSKTPIKESGGLFEEHASDCVITIDQKITEKLMTRYLRILKYRCSSHGTNEYPFLLTKAGVSIFPITDITLNRPQSNNRVLTGIKKLDSMLGGGFLETSSIMVSGSSGTAKSLISATFAASCASSNKKVIFLSYEESISEYTNNVQSAGIDLKSHIEKNTLLLKSSRSVNMGIEEHLISIINLVDEFQPEVLIIDPITSLLDMGSSLEVKSLLLRFISYLKNRHITILLTELLKEEKQYRSIIGLSSLVDTWIKLSQEVSNGELNRSLRVIKSRGTKTSNQIKEFIITDKGLNIEEPYIGSGGVLFGSEKEEKILINQQKHQSLQQELNEIEVQLKKIDTNDAANCRFKFDLIEKKNRINLDLSHIESINVLNKKIREE